MTAINCKHFFDIISTIITYYYGKGHGKPLKSTGPPKPASASNKLIITAIAASSLLSGTACSLDSLDDAVDKYLIMQ